MSYARGSHTVFQHRYHIVWITKYRYEVLEGVAGADLSGVRGGAIVGHGAAA